MTLGQSAATAAAIAIDDGISVQQVPYEKLSIKLRADGQALTKGIDDVSISGIVVDNNDPGATVLGTWASSTAVGGYQGANYLAGNGALDEPQKSVRFTPSIPAAGIYEVTLRWTQEPNRATIIPVKITHSGGVETVIVNQQVNGNLWNSLGSFHFEAGTSGNLLIDAKGANGFVIADAAQWTAPGANSMVEVMSFVPSATRGSAREGELVFTRKGGVSTPLTVNYTTSGSAASSEISPALTGSVVIPQNKREMRLSLQALKGSVPLGTRTLQVTLTSGSGYLIGERSSVTLSLLDAPFDAWRFSNFSSEELANESIAGASGDPDHDGVNNLMEFFTGGRGLVADAIPAPGLLNQDGKLYLKVRRHHDAQDVKMRVWESDNLTGWVPSPELNLPRLFERDGDFQDIGIPVRPTIPTGEGTRFFQLRIEK